MKTSQRRKFLLICGFIGWVTTQIACGGTSGDTEQARFLMDGCNPTSAASAQSNCTQAAALSANILVSDPYDPEVAVLGASAYLGVARLDLLSFMSSLATLENEAETASSTDYSQFRTFINNYETDNSLTIDPPSLLDAQYVFTGGTAAGTSVMEGAAVDANGVATDDAQREAFFLQGLIQALDSFIRPVKLSTQKPAVGDITTGLADATGVPAIVKNDMIEADANLSEGGLTNTSILTPVRSNYCRCSQNPATHSFDGPCLRDLMRCELYLQSDGTLPDGASVEQDYTGGEDPMADSADQCAALLGTDISTCDSTHIH